MDDSSNLYANQSAKEDGHLDAYADGNTTSPKHSNTNRNANDRLSAKEHGDPNLHTNEYEDASSYTDNRADATKPTHILRIHQRE